MPHSEDDLPDIGNSQTLLDLATGHLRWPRSPWKSQRGGRSYCKPLCRDMCRRLKLLSKLEADSYGQGYSSFVDVWFYKNTNDFRVLRTADKRPTYVGLWVLFHNMSPLYVVGEGEKSWDETGSASYVPSVKGVDNITSNAVDDLAEKVDRYLLKNGLMRLRRNQVDRLLPPDCGVDIKTNLNDRDLRVFDALFHWMD